MGWDGMGMAWHGMDEASGAPAERGQLSLQRSLSGPERCSACAARCRFPFFFFFLLFLLLPPPPFFSLVTLCYEPSGSS